MSRPSRKRPSEREPEIEVEVEPDREVAGAVDAGEDEVEGAAADDEGEIADDERAPAAGATTLPARSEDPDAGALVAYDPLQRYLQEIRRYPLLSREEEHELAVRYQRDQDVEAAYQLLTGNLRLVVMIAREYQRSFRALLDLIQEGNIGLMEAVKNFDPYRGVRFPSYAVWWIRAYVIRYVMNNWRMVKLGTTQAQRKLFFNLQKEKDKLEAEGFVPDPTLIAKRLDVKEREVIEMDQRLSGRDLSVDAPVREGEDATLLDVLKSETGTLEDEVADRDFRAQVGAKIREFGETLQDKDRVIFDERLLSEEPHTLQEIGDRYGISRERVRQIESRVKRRLRAFLEAHFEDLRGVDVDVG